MHTPHRSCQERIISHQMRVTSHEFMFLYEKKWVVTPSRHVARGIISHQVRGGKPRIQTSLQRQENSFPLTLLTKFCVHITLSTNLQQENKIFDWVFLLLITGQVSTNLSQCQMVGQIHVSSSVLVCVICPILYILFFFLFFFWCTVESCIPINLLFSIRTCAFPRQKNREILRPHHSTQHI